jgi:mannose-6-phosphate isomerase-like protein (cupin superfamily)
MKTAKIWDEDREDTPGEKLLIDRNETETIALGYVSIFKGESTQLGFHDDEEEIYVILKGRAVLALGDETKEVGAGETVYVPRNTEHRMRCISDEKLEYLYFANWPE